MTKIKFLPGSLLATLLLAITSLGAHAASLGDGIIGYWNLDGNTTDGSATGADGTWSGTTGAYSSTTAKFGQGALLDGVDDFIAIDTVAANTFDPPTGDITVSAWIQTPGLNKSWQGIVAKGEGTNWRLARQSTTTNAAFAGGGGSPGDTVNSSANINDGAIHHLVGVIDADGHRTLYVDGVPAPQAGTFTLASNGKFMQIGANPDAGRSFIGTIDDVIIWDRPLKGFEVQQVYAGGSGTVGSDIILGAAATDSDDGGQLPDWWEIANFGSIAGLPTDNSDADGLDDAAEFANGTDPNSADTDGDGLDDDAEITAGTDPCNPDSDADGFEDGLEVHFGKDPLNAISGVPPITNDLCGYWKLDGDYTDSSLTGAHGTLLGDDGTTPNFETGSGFFGNAARLVRDPNGDGSVTSERIQINGVPEDTFDFVAQSITISAWFEVGGFGSQAWQALVAKGEGNSWRVARAGNTPSMGYAGGTSDISSGVDVSTGRHHVVAVTEHGVNTRIYIDGALAATSTGAPSITNNSDEFMMIGGNPQGAPNNRNWNGLIDDVAIWKRVLTPLEISQIYNEGAGSSVQDLIDSPDSDGDGFGDDDERQLGSDPLDAASFPFMDLVAYWPLDCYYNDLSGNGASGTLVNQDAVAADFISGGGFFGNAANLSAAGNEYIRIDGVPESTFDFAGQSITISAWFDVTAFTTNWQALIAKGEGAGWRVARRNNEPRMSYAGGTGDIPGGGVGPDITTGRHHLLAITEHGVSTRLYVDGSLIATGGVPNITDRNSLFMTIGSNPENLGRSWNGSIDDVAIWNRVLTDGEIAAIYNGGTGASIRSLAKIPFAIDGWREAFYPGSTATAGPGADTTTGANGETILESFAQGFDPTAGAPGDLALGGGTITNVGTPIALVEAGGPGGPDHSFVYLRRADYQDAGLKYTAQFNHALDPGSWEDGTGTPVVIATGTGANGEALEAVKVPFPFFLSTFRKARFARLSIEIVYPD